VKRPSPLLLRAGLRHLLQHRWQALLALSGITLGVAVVLAVDLANSGARAAFELSARQLQGAATHRLVVSGANLPEAVYTELTRQAGAPHMAPVVSGWVGIEGQTGRYQLVGFDLFAEAPFRSQLTGIALGTGLVSDWLTQPDALVINTTTADLFGLSENDSLQVIYRERKTPLSVLHIDAQPDRAADNLLLLDIATAQVILGMQGYLSHVDLILDAGSELWIRQRIPPQIQLQTVADQTEGITRLSAAFELNLTAMSLLAMLVGMFLIFNAMSFSIVQRRKLFGRLRVIGVTQRELFRLILFEAVVVAIVGTLLGLLLGIWLGQGLTRLVAATVSELYYNVSVTALHLDGRAVLLATGLGISATLLATLSPAWQASRTPPLTTLSRAALEQTARRGVKRWALIGLLLLSAGLLLALAFPGGVIMGFAGLFALVLGAAMMTPLIIRLLHRLLARIGLPGIWHMGVRDLDRHLSRLGVAVAALMVALSASVGVGIMVESMRGSVNTWLSDLLSADLYVAAEGFADGAHLPDTALPEIAQLDAVADISRYRGQRLPLGGRHVELIGAHLAAPSRRGFDLLDATGDAWKLFDTGGVLVSEPLAYRLGLVPGDPLELPTPAGPWQVQVAAVFRDYASEHGRIFVDEASYRQHWPDRDVDTLALFARNGDIDALRRAVSEVAAGQSLVLTPAVTILDESMAVFDRTFRVTEVLRAISLVVAFVGVLSALMALQLERRKEYAVLRALGLTRRQIAGLIGGESLLMGLLAAAVALPTGGLMAWVLIQSVQRRAFGWTMPFEPDPGLLIQTMAVGLLAAGLAAVYPAWRSAHRDPAPQLRED
jgi:putative ABC transport system permease protein